MWWEWLGNWCVWEWHNFELWRKGGKAIGGKVQAGWKWPVGLLRSAQITGNQMGATHPPLTLNNLASNPSVQCNLSCFKLHKTDFSLKCKMHLYFCKGVSVHLIPKSCWFQMILPDSACFIVNSRVRVNYISSFLWKALPQILLKNNKNNFQMIKTWKRLLIHINQLHDAPNIHLILQFLFLYLVQCQSDNVSISFYINFLFYV